MVSKLNHFKKSSRKGQSHHTNKIFTLALTLKQFG
jgi:hypothetical protein